MSLSLTISNTYLLTSLASSYERSFGRVQVAVNVQSVDGVHDPAVVAINAASAALAVSPVQWAGPVAAARVTVRGASAGPLAHAISPPLLRTGRTQNRPRLPHKPRAYGCSGAAALVQEAGSAAAPAACHAAHSVLVCVPSWV